MEPIPIGGMIERYGRLAEMGQSATVLAGRYRIQAEAERRIVGDIRPKLALEPSHRLLDIGCGPGTLLIPLSFEVAEAWGIDHANIIELAARRVTAPHLNWLAGRFPDTAPPGQFDRILAYSVVQCLQSLDEVAAFLDAAVALLREGGRLLVGDLPNRDRRDRFNTSAAGQAFKQNWDKLAATEEAAADRSRFSDVFQDVTGIGQLNDASILGLVARYRVAGYHTYLVPQDPRLPFGQTREDLLIVRP